MVFLPKAIEKFTCFTHHPFNWPPNDGSSDGSKYPKLLTLMTPCWASVIDRHVAPVEAGTDGCFKLLLEADVCNIMCSMVTMFHTLTLVILLIIIGPT